MAKIESIFHSLQNDGERAVGVHDVRPGYSLGLKPFINKISNHFKDPFPIYKASNSTLATISNRFYQVMAVEGLSATDNMPQPDQRAVSELLYEEALNTFLPSRRFGVEISDSQNNPVGMVFEAMKAINTPFTSEEIGRRKASDCNFFRIHFLGPIDSQRSSNEATRKFPSKFTLFNMSMYLSVERTIHQRDGGANIQFAALGEDAFSLTKKPFGIQPTRTEELFFLMRPSQYGELAQTVISSVSDAFNLLWTINREPKSILKQAKGFVTENHVRRRKGIAPFSPVLDLLIDEQELRRVESHRAKEIAEAFAKSGGYKIPGLVLVDSYTRLDTGKRVEAYARCANELVRRSATELLQQNERDYDKIAELVRTFGADATKARHGQSTIFVPQITRGP